MFSPANVFRYMVHRIKNVIGPTKINHVSANYTKLIFANIFSSEYGIPFS